VSLYPAGYTSALALTFDVDAESPILATDPTIARDLMVMSHQAFGPRVGVPRILRLLEEERVPATFFVPGWTARAWPAALEAILAAGHEVGHHSDLHHDVPHQTDEAQRADFARALETLQTAGVDVRGHRGAMWRATRTTFELIAAAGLRYDSTLMDADAPYVLEVAGHRFAQICPFWGLDDWEQYGFLPEPNIGSQIETPSKVAELVMAEIDAKRRWGGVTCMTFHPFLSGRASRVEAIRQMIDHARSAGDVWIAPMHEIASRALALPGIECRPPHEPDLTLGPY
jgi:peptidoglycan-N-acetylglucosamine deacetylase